MVPSLGAVPKRPRNACLRRNVPAQQSRRPRLAINFNFPSNAPVTNTVPDNPPVERAPVGRRGDVQAAALHDRGRGAAADCAPVPPPVCQMVPSLGAVPKRPRNACLRRNVPAQQSRRPRLAINFNSPSNAPVTNTVPDNLPVERAPVGRRGDVQAAALHDRGRELETMDRVLGEIAFQLDSRILTYIFTDKIRLYGFRIADINANITEVAGASGRCAEMNARNTEIMNNLRNFGYCPINHSTFAELIVNTYGILKEKPQCQTTLENYNNLEYLKKVVTENTPPPLLRDMMVLLTCLSNLSMADGKPMFIW
ncbi:uncharacterized protein LOC144504882 isoform X2 [Mustelus asterias]